MNLSSFSPRNINQDPLENFFSQIRCFGIRNPTCTSFIYSFKSLLLNNFVSTRSLGSNCEDDIIEGPLNNLDNFITQDIHIITPQVNNIFIPNIPKTSLTITDFATPYVAGVILKKFLAKYNTCITCKEIVVSTQKLPLHKFISLKEYKNCRLMYPSESFVNFVQVIASQIYDITPQIICSYDIKKNIFNYVQYNENILCQFHKENMKFLINVVINIVVYNYIKKINNVLNGRDHRNINFDYITELVHKKY